ncbi:MULTISPECIES: VOC family protein [Asticcacaulis]|uniref:VOC family protein n=1 Tax=Asticcacaulis TaxID=76890 RepID=UPI001AEA7F1A|nr:MULTISPECIES: VOC family protein [Asticcacaulis]MBP2161525.1 catechol 2,3-dioxygenase-like lactoylglutathione lyase family enzyme [Asticcacaulis solisilvae]MDR6802624.1 catechol 2,3-dioxygenase-like lactoylglutathione lyase family enzyme [Asticcacaulis sp. BE141]
MIDHMGLKVSDRERSKAFYTPALAPLGYTVVMDGQWGTGYGAGKPDLWLEDGKPSDRIHVALKAKDRAAVDAFYQAAMAAGGTDNGAPGIRAHYHPNYYGAFVRDPDGHNIEAVCHTPE